MKNRNSVPNLSLVIVLTAALLVCRILRVCIPFAILPQLNIPNMVLLSGAALLLDHIRSGRTKAPDFTMPILAALTFGLLPWLAGFAEVREIWKPALTGGVVFGLVAWIYNSMAERIATGPVAKSAPVFSVLGLYLAAQGFAGIIL